MGTSNLKGITNLASQDKKITNLVVANPNDEVTHTLQDEVKQIIIRNRDYLKTQIAFEVNESGTNFFTIGRGNTLALDSLFFTGESIYLQCPASCVVEIIEFY